MEESKLSETKLKFLDTCKFIILIDFHWLSGNRNTQQKLPRKIFIINGTKLLSVHLVPSSSSAVTNAGRKRVFISKLSHGLCGTVSFSGAFCCFWFWHFSGYSINQEHIREEITQCWANTMLWFVEYFYNVVFSWQVGTKYRWKTM